LTSNKVKIGMESAFRTTPARGVHPAQLSGRPMEVRSTSRSGADVAVRRSAIRVIG